MLLFIFVYENGLIYHCRKLIIYIHGYFYHVVSSFKISDGRVAKSMCIPVAGKLHDLFLKKNSFYE
jgi:hypothetical protein